MLAEDTETISGMTLGVYLPPELAFWVQVSLEEHGTHCTSIYHL